MSTLTDHKVVNLYKKLGETPLECLETYRTHFDISKSVSLTYAGRLDPLAEGVLIALVGEETKQKEKYLVLDKKYEFEVLFGFATDTFDTLGLITDIHHMDVQESELSKKLGNYLGDVEMEYPPYSSKTVSGKPLFQYAREGGLDNIEMPRYRAYISDLRLQELATVTNNDLLKYIERNISLVKGDFRQDKIMSVWQKSIAMLEERTHAVAKITMDCTSGMYVRRLTHELGRDLGGSALAYSIKRTRVGEYDITDSIRLDD